MTIPERILVGDFAGWLADAMAERRLSLRHVAMRTGLDHSSISRLRRGDRQPDMATLLALLVLFVPAEPSDKEEAS